MIRSDRNRKKLTVYMLVAVFAVILVVMTQELGTKERPVFFEAQTEAVKKYEQAVDAIRRYRQDLGIPLDKEDVHQTGMIGEAYTPLTTTVGDAAAKRTASTRDMAALVVRLMHEAGVRSGDIVGANLSGSFPGLNLAFLTACEVLEAKPVYTVSASASMYGANIPELSFPEMVIKLHEDGYINSLPQAVSIGGDQDIGAELDPAFCDNLKAQLGKSVLTLIYEPNFEKNVEERITIYEQFGPLKLFVSIGGHTASIGLKDNAVMYMQGVISPRGVHIDSGSGLIVRYLNDGIQVIQLLNIKRLVSDYGLAFDPPVIPPIGESTVYWIDAYPSWLAVAGILLILGVLLWFRLRAMAGW